MDQAAADRLGWEQAVSSHLGRLVSAQGQLDRAKAKLQGAVDAYAAGARLHAMATQELEAIARREASQDPSLRWGSPKLEANQSGP
jgi:hypothetical protein